MTNLTAIIDIDFVKYAASSAGETRTIKAYHPIDGTEWSCKTRTALYGHWLKKSGGLLAFQLGGGDAFENGEAGLFGFGDRKRGKQFWGVNRLHHDAIDRLAAGGAGGERRLAGFEPVVEAVAAEFAGTFNGGVAVNGHGNVD